MALMIAPDDVEGIGEVLASPWSSEGYRRHSRGWLVGYHEPAAVTDDGVNVLDMPIRLPGGPLALPDGMPVWLVALVERIDAFERRLHPASVGMHAYLTVNQGRVAPGASQRNGGAHFDGMQGVRYPDKLPVCHQYLYATILPTILYEHPFELVHLDAARHDFFAACERQKDPRRAWQPDPGQIVLTTAYTVHESPVADRDVDRTFVRVEYSHKRADREGNTRNAALCTAHWEYVPRPIPEGLV